MVYVEYTLVNISLIDHPHNLSQRLHLLDGNRRNLAAISLTGADGQDLIGQKLKPQESVSARALFEVPGDFVPVAFTYTYDVNGFGIFTYLIDP